MHEFGVHLFGFGNKMWWKCNAGTFYVKHTSEDTDENDVVPGYMHIIFCNFRWFDGVDDVWHTILVYVHCTTTISYKL